MTDGVPLHEVQAAMGHSVITTTMKYAHLSPQYLSRARASLEAAYGNGGPAPQLRVIEGRAPRPRTPGARQEEENRTDSVRSRSRKTLSSKAS